MKIKMRLLLLILFGLFACRQNSNSGPSANAELDAIHRGEYRIALYKDNEKDFDPHKLTHIIVVGSAVKEDSDQFFQSGLSRAQRYKEVWPDHQVVIMSSPDVKGMTDEQVFVRYKLPVIKTVFKKFTAPLLLDEIEQFDQIASFDFYGHASPWAMIVGKNNAAFDPSAHYQRLKDMRWRFVGNAYATLNACNSGFLLAPDLSQGLSIPVSGSLAGSYFERIESDGHWYKEEDQSKGNKVLSNSWSFKSKVSCATGLCTRMKSARTYYNSYWGDFNAGGLSFDKFFCNYEDSRDGHCEKGMATSLLAFPSVKPIELNSDYEDIKDVVFDWLCSTGNTKSYYEKCRYGIEASLARGDLEYQTFPGNELKCDFISCNSKIVCKYKTTIEDGPTPGSCRLETLPNFAPSNAAREFLSIMRGFDMIRQ